MPRPNAFSQFSLTSIIPRQHVRPVVDNSDGFETRSLKCHLSLRLTLKPSLAYSSMHFAVPCLLQCYVDALQISRLSRKGLFDDAWKPKCSPGLSSQWLLLCTADMKSLI